MATTLPRTRSPRAPAAKLEPYDFERSLGYWLTLATQAYHRRLTSQLRPHGITYRQSLVVGWLALHGELTQVALARLMMVEAPTLVRLLDRMEHAGIVRRVGDPADRRRWLVKLTAAAVPIWKRITAAARDCRRQAAQGLSAEQQHQLQGLLQLVLQNLEATPLRQPAAARRGSTKAKA
jgi:MarR family transcriptional regulator, transcriptional regulator for hemolysin